MSRFFNAFAATLFTVTWLFSVSTPAVNAEEIPARERILSGLRKDHPRLLATQEDFERISEQSRSDQRLGKWLLNLRSQADQLLSEPPVVYEIRDGKRLLSVSRKVKDRLLLLGLIWQLSREHPYADRAWQELEAVTAFKDWNPAHFLDTAEMTFAVSIGYDWLYDAWDDAQRDRLRTAIVRMGLQPGLSVYRKQEWWARATHNWNQVCNGGLAVGALAIGDVEVDVASEVLHSAVLSLPLAMREFAPDGGWGEGPGYWRYATEYNVYALAALQSALGTDFNLGDMPGFAKTGEFPLYFVGPTGKTFNFADAHDGWRGAPQLFWFAGRFGRMDYAAAQLPFADQRPTALDVIWGTACLDGESPAVNMPTARHFRGVSVVTLRGNWNDPRAMYVAFKGGDNRVNHGHLDLGTFVLDGLGQRWATDLGPDDYNLPGYFGRQRWTYFRNNTQSHNTLIISGENQSSSARAEVVRFATRDDWSGGVVDLSRAWPQVTRAWRGIALEGGQRVIIQDEVTAEQAVSVAWQMLTAAQIEVDGQRATLRLGGEQLTARIVSPDEARWEVSEINVKAPERQVVDTRKLVATIPQATKHVRFLIVLSGPNDAPEPAIISLERWPSSPE